MISTGAITGGVITFEIFDGVTWLAVKGFRPESYLSDSAITLVTSTSRAWQFSIAGFTQFRARLSTIIVGAGSISVTTIVSSAPDVSGVTVGIDPSVHPQGPGVSATALRVLEAKPQTGTQTSVASSASDTTVLAANANRIGCTVYNDSTAILYLLLAVGTSTNTNYTVQVAAGGYYEAPYGYAGIIKGLWASATGNARITEIT